jgi:subtilase family serine protease
LLPLELKAELSARFFRIKRNTSLKCASLLVPSTFGFTRIAMKTMSAFSWHSQRRVLGWLIAGALTAASLGAQSLPARISADVTNSERTTLTGSLHPFAQAQFDTGRLPANTKLEGVSIVFSRSAAQQADLEALIAAQQDPTSPLYHQWLTPDQFAARFGVADADLEKVKSWLEQQGFAIDSVARSRSMVRFSGTASQVEGAFSTEMHYYNIKGARHFAPSTDLSVPAALAPVVLAVRNLNDFRPKPLHVAPAVVPDFTSNQSKFVHFAPGDIWKVYDINPSYQSGYTGVGQAIAIVGQSAIVTSDIENFQNAAGLLVKDPTQVLVPGTGASTVYTGDEAESDIDLEWSGAIATGANIIFVYVGSSTSSSVFDSILYAIDEDLAPIISVSYGACETEFGSASAFQPYEAAGQQAAAQGQTLIASSGDSGSTSCSGFTNLTTAQQQALAVSYPASSAYFTAAGGTEISQANAAYMTAGTAYWATTNGSDVLNSALQYIPEVAWNDDSSANGLSSTGGGTSAYIARPSWQTGVPGIPSGSNRLVPDISLYSSPNFPGYLFCSSDTSNNISGSCSNGFRDAAKQYLTVAGGTSFAAPIFAGMLAIINQQKGYTSGQGLINPKLYTLAANSTTYASAFHDTTSGNNNCLAGITYCANTNGFSTTAGYDEVTGLGSVEVNNLIAAWPASPTTPTPITTAITISTASFTPTKNQPNLFSFSLAAASGTVTPTGNLTLSIDGGGTAYSTGGTTVTVPLSGIVTAGTASATYQATFTTSGTHQVVAHYSGNSTFAASTGIIQVTVAATGSFTLAATGVNVAQGSQSVTTITVTPAGGYTGTVNITPSSSTANFCYSTTAATVPGTTAVTTTMTIDTNLTDCGASNAQTGSGMHRFIAGGHKASLSSRSPSISVAAFSFAGLLLTGLIGWRRRQLRFLSCLIALGLIGFVFSGCGGGGGSTSSNNNYTTKGSYTVTLTGQDSTTASLSATTTFTLKVQ